MVYGQEGLDLSKVTENVNTGIDTAGFTTDQVERFLFVALNKTRKNAQLDDLDTNEVLKKAAACQAEYMAKIGKVTLTPAPHDSSAGGQ